MLRVWMDDEAVRDPDPAKWTIVRTADEAIALLETGKVDLISLDHDLGDKRLDPYPHEITGMAVVKWMIENEVWPRVINVHSHNPDARKWMLADLQRWAPDATMIGDNIFNDGTHRWLEWYGE